MPYKDKEDEKAYKAAHYQKNKEEIKAYKAAYRPDTSWQEVTQSQRVETEWHHTRPPHVGRAVRYLHQHNTVCGLQTRADGRLRKSNSRNLDHDHDTGLVRDVVCHKRVTRGEAKSTASRLSRSQHRRHAKQRQLAHQDQVEGIRHNSSVRKSSELICMLSTFLNLITCVVSL